MLKKTTQDSRWFYPCMSNCFLKEDFLSISGKFPNEQFKIVNQNSIDTDSSLGGRSWSFKMLKKKAGTDFNNLNLGAIYLKVWAVDLIINI